VTARKSERVMNLAICLLLARRFVEKARIREMVEGYAGLGDAAFERTFERDKDELRSLGVPIETGSNDPFFDDELGYRIRREDFELPAIEFTPAEAAVLGLASRVWESATQADQAVTALAKLRAAGIEPDPDRIAGLTPSVSAREPAFEALWQAANSHTPVRFGYHGEQRTVEPWTLSYRNGAWYLTGHDRDRQDTRTFKVARVEPPVTTLGRPGSVRPATLEPTEALGRIEPAAPDAEALVAVRGDNAPALRRRGTPVPAGEIPDGLPPGFAAYRVSYGRRAELVGEVCASGPDVLVLGPEDLRAAVVAQLRAVAGVA
jgi:proteasome accessory factor B